MDDSRDEGRSAALGFFTAIANVYLLAFAADAALSVIDELLLAAGESPVTMARNLLASAVIAGSLLMVFVVTFVPQLPKILFVPLIACALWMALGAPPFSAADNRQLQLFLALSQLALAGLAFLYVQMTAGGWLLSAQRLPHKRHLFLRIVAASFVTLTLIPIALVAFGIAAVVSYAEAQTKGYLQFTWSDVQARETVLTRGGKTVHLVATAHIAERTFYETIYAGIPVNAVVLAEGMTDKKKLLGTSGMQDEAADTLGLQTQQVFERLLGPAIADGGDGRSPSGAPATAKTRPDVVRADLDVSDLSATTIKCMREDLAIARSSFDELMQMQADQLKCSEAERKIYYDEILYTRNNKVLAEFDRLAGKYDIFVVPWGALHMPDFELAFKERGFQIARMRMLTLARYQTVAGRMLEGLAAYRMQGAANRPYRAP